MDSRRTPAPESLKAASLRDAASSTRSLVDSGATMRDVVVAGGLRGFRPEEMFPGRAA